MNDLYGGVLREIVQRRGRGVCEDPRQTRALLRDLLGSQPGQHTRAINVLIHAMEERVPEELLAAQESGLVEMAVRRLIVRLQADWGMSEAGARWSVQTWGLALGVLSPEEASAMSLEAGVPRKSARWTTWVTGETRGPVEAETLPVGAGSPEVGGAVRKRRLRWLVAVLGALVLLSLVPAIRYSLLIWGSVPGVSVSPTIVPAESAEALVEISVDEAAEEVEQAIQVVGSIGTATDEKSVWLPVEPAPARDAAFETEKTITNSIGMKLVLIPAGEFMMGSPESDEFAADDEMPQHRVRITKPFYLGVYEVTQKQYEQVMHTNPSRFGGDWRRPVESVSWDDAVEFCRRLSNKEPREYRLPTEAEWEYACRAGSTTRFSWGDSDSESVMKDFCWYSCNAYEWSWTIPHAAETGTQPVGQKRPNAWGLHDMHGNVFEWCKDWYDRDYYGRSSPSDPQGPSAGSYRVNRGGGWRNRSTLCRSAERYWSSAGIQDSIQGFRVACSVDRSSRRNPASSALSLSPQNRSI